MLGSEMRNFLIAGALVSLVLAGNAVLSSCDRGAIGKFAGPPAAETIASSGKIFGLALGSEMEEAREKLAPLRDTTNHIPDAKELSGRRIYWKLRGTEYEWIMAWADAEGKIARMRAVYRPDSPLPFEKVGNLQAATAVSDTTAKWDLHRPNGSAYRLIAQGSNRQATTVYMFSTELPADGQRAGEAEEGEED